MRKVRNPQYSGVTVALVGIIVVILVVVIVAASYFALGGFSGGTKSTTSTTSSKSETSTHSTTTSQQTTSSKSTTSSSKSTSSQTSNTISSTSAGSFDVSGLISNIDNLFGNFSQMTVEYSSTGSNSSNSVEDFTYVVLGHPFVNSTHFTEVNFSSSGSGSTPQSTVLWFDPSGNVSLVQSYGQNYTGSIAESFALAYTSVFQAFFTDASSIVNAYSSLAYSGSSPQTFGSTQLNVATYSWNDLSIGTYTIGVGNLPGTAVYLITSWEASAGGNSASFHLISLTKA